LHKILSIYHFFSLSLANCRSHDLQNYDAIIVRSDTKITADVIASGAQGRLKAVGRAGVGIDNIDVNAATKHNVIVLK
jgi:D-3-phosphoglycerate dehydrogenase